MSTYAESFRKLATFSSNNPRLQALTEFDRLIKSIDQIECAGLRASIRRSLNLGEVYHYLLSADALANGNQIR